MYKYEPKSVIVDGIKFNRDRQTGYYMKSGSGRKRLHVYVWEKHNGPVPKGMSIHHIDHDKDNNDISNLTLMDSQEHRNYHVRKYVKENIQALRDNLTKNARPEANKWHGSEAGRKWHKKQYTVSLGARKMHNHICEVCGKRYEDQHINISRFCSKACKSKFRRVHELDHIEKNCVICGKRFRTNKYGTVQTCSRRCGGILCARNRSSKNKVNKACG
jgi:predicted nucleic acid-binding Zn ribbon protein